MNKQEAIQRLLDHAALCQRTANEEYKRARFQREQYLDGCVSNTLHYEHSMYLARLYQDQAMMVLAALI